MKTPTKITEEVIRIFSGGMVRTSNLEWDKRMVMLMVQQERDYVIKDKVSTDFYAGQPIEDSLFTSYEGLQTTWDDSAKVDALDLPMGYLSLPDDRGIRLSPTVLNGENPYRRAPSGSLQNGTKLWAEGFILWMVRPPKQSGNRRIVFQNMPSRDMKVNLDVIIGDTSSYQNDEVGIPDGLDTVVIDRVLRKMGYRQLADKRNDVRDDPKGS